VFSDEAGGTRAEVGLLPFARVALQVATRVLPPYRSRFSKHQFAQPQLLAVLCLMRYEDWTFREAEVRLREHRELREALQLRTVPDYTTLYRFLKRLDDDTIDRGRGETVRQLRRGRRSARVTAGVDGTGLSQNAVSTFFIRRMEQHARGMTRHQHIRQRWGAQSILPANPRRGVPQGAIRYQMHRAFPQKHYGQRAKIEPIFSVVKRKLSSRAPGRSLASQIRQALLLGLAYNLYRLRHPRHPRGCKQSHFLPFRINSYKKSEGGGYPPPTTLSPRTMDTSPCAKLLSSPPDHRNSLPPRPRCAKGKPRC